MAGHWWDQGWTKGQQSDQRNRHRTQGLAPGDPPPPHSLHSINHIHKYKYNTQIQKIQIQIQVLKVLPRATHHLHSLSMVSIRSRNYSQDYCICISVSIKYSELLYLYFCINQILTSFYTIYPQTFEIERQQISCVKL